MIGKGYTTTPTSPPPPWRLVRKANGYYTVQRRTPSNQWIDTSTGMFKDTQLDEAKAYVDQLNALEAERVSEVVEVVWPEER